MYPLYEKCVFIEIVYANFELYFAISVSINNLLWLQWECHDYLGNRILPITEFETFLNKLHCQHHGIKGSNLLFASILVPLQVM